MSYVVTILSMAVDWPCDNGIRWHCRLTGYMVPSTRHPSNLGGVNIGGDSAWFTWKKKESGQKFDMQCSPEIMRSDCFSLFFITGFMIDTQNVKWSIYQELLHLFRGHIWLPVSV